MTNEQADPTTERFSVQQAHSAAEENNLSQWVGDFLASEGSDNAELGDELKRDIVDWVGPVRVDFDHLHRLAGPRDQPTLGRLDEDDLDTVEGMEDSIEDGWSPAPLVATFRDDHLRVEDGNHRIEGLRRAGHDDYWTVIGLLSPADRDAALAFALD